jgi:hypothetical protein
MDDQGQLHAEVGHPDPGMPAMVRLEIVDLDGSHTFWLLPNTARSFASDLLGLADEAEAS